MYIFTRYYCRSTTAAVEWHFVANGQNRYRDSYLIKAMWPFSLPDF